MCIQNYVVDELQKEVFDRFWLFFYEVLPESYLSDPWKQIKRNGVTFIDNNQLVWK